MRPSEISGLQWISGQCGGTSHLEGLRIVRKAGDGSGHVVQRYKGGQVYMTAWATTMHDRTTVTTLRSAVKNQKAGCCYRQPRREMGWHMHKQNLTAYAGD